MRGDWTDIIRSSRNHKVSDGKFVMLKKLNVIIVIIVAIAGCILTSWIPLFGYSADHEWRDLNSAEALVLYGVCNVEDVLIVIDPATGAGTEVGPLGIDYVNGGINFHPDGKLYGLLWNNLYSDYRLYTIDLDTGNAFEVGIINIGLSMESTDLAVDRSGCILGIVGNKVIDIDRFSGQGTVVFELPSGFDIPSLDFAPDGNLYAVGDIPTGYGLIKINVGAQTYEILSHLQNLYTGLCHNSSGILFGSDGDELWIIDPNGGETLIGPIGFHPVNGIDFSPIFQLDVVYGLPYARRGYLTWWKIALVNSSNDDVIIDRIRFDAYGPVNISKILFNGAITVPAGSVLSSWIELTVSSKAPLGKYKIDTVAEYMSGDIASDLFELEVVE